MRGVSNKHCLLTFFILSETIRPVELIFHMNTTCEKLAKIDTNCSGHMTKMANIPIYGKNPSKIFFSRNRRVMTLGLGV